MYESRFGLLLQRIEPHAQLLRTWPLQGGVSAQVTVVEYMRADGQTKKLIVRQHGALDLARNPQIAADEFRLLQLLRACGIATPTPYYVDQSGELFATPVIAIEYIEGTTACAPEQIGRCVQQLARQLALIHMIDRNERDFSFLPSHAIGVARMIGEQPMAVQEAFQEGQIRAIVETAWPFAQQNRSVLLHGDYWPGNILWNHGQLVAVIDWEDAAIGDPLADVANTRLELLWAWGREAMHQFTDHYAALVAIDLSQLPYWDLYSALRPIAKIATWGLDARTEQSMREQHRYFTRQAFEQIGRMGVRT